MASRRVLKSVLRNFLGTYTSRDTERDGYWLFGFLCKGADLTIDLLGDRQRRGGEPSEDARLIAIHAFVEQLGKANLLEAQVKSAQLVVAISPVGIERVAGGNLRIGHEMTFNATATTDRDFTYRATSKRFVAPHDQSSELRSIKDWPRWVL